MASVTAKEIPDVQGFMTDFWVMIKEFYKPEKTVGYWEDFDKRCNALNEKYHNNRLNQRLMIAFLEFLCEESTSKEKYREYKADRIAKDFIKTEIEVE